jgi:hypothetical protein
LASVLQLPFFNAPPLQSPSGVPYEKKSTAAILLPGHSTFKLAPSAPAVVQVVFSNATATLVMVNAGISFTRLMGGIPCEFSWAITAHSSHR